MRMTPDEIVSLYKKHNLKARCGTANTESGRCCMLGILAYDKNGGKHVLDTTHAIQILGLRTLPDFIIGFDSSGDFGGEDYKLGQAVNLACKAAGLFD